MKKFTLLLSAMLFSVMSFATVITFDADVDKGNAGTDSNNAAAYTITKDGVTVTVSSGILGTYNNEMHYRIYKNQTLTVTSTVGNVTSVEFTCTANDDAKYGPGCFTWSTGNYTYSGAKGTWSGSASEIVFTASSNQVRATQVVVTVSDGSENPGGETPETEVTVSDLNYADAIYYEYDGIAYYDFDLYNDSDPETHEYVYPELYFSVEAKSKTAINGTYSMVWAGLWTSANDSVLTDEESPVGSVTIKNVDNEGNYSFKGSFVGTDGKTYTFDKVLPVWAFDYDTFEEVTLNEDGTDNPGTDNPGNDNPGTSTGTITFDADVDKGNAIEYVDGATGKEFTISKDGVTLTVSSGLLGKYNNELHYRIYKSQTLTISSTVGNIVSVEFTCTANDDAKYGPGCFTVADGSYSYSGAVGTWSGSADEVVFSASLNQVRASQIVVKVATATGVEDVKTVVIPVKVMQNGQVLIKRGENVYNVVGVQVK